jgi:hypothetical protein
LARRFLRGVFDLLFRPMRIAAALVVAALAPMLQPDPAARLLPDVRALAAADTNGARFEALTALLRQRKLAFEVEPFTIDKPVGAEPRTDGRNVVVSIGKGTEHVVIGAHYDAVRLPDKSLARGAVDNAASSAILVRLAEMMRGDGLTRQVHIVWFDMEELGLRGSAAYVDRHAARKTSAMLNFDINAYGDTVLFGPSEGDTNQALKRTLLTTCAAEALNCVGFPQMPPGDDRRFTARGIPTLSIAMLPSVEVHQLWLTMNAGANAGLAKETVPSVLQTIHTPADTIEKVNEDSMARMLRFATALARSVSK